MLYLSRFQFPNYDRKYKFRPDADPADVKKWTELANVRAYYEFYKRHEKQFEE